MWIWVNGQVPLNTNKLDYSLPHAGLQTTRTQDSCWTWRLPISSDVRPSGSMHRANELELVSKVRNSGLTSALGIPTTTVVSHDSQTFELCRPGEFNPSRPLPFFAIR